MLKINLMPKTYKVDGMILKGRIQFEYLEAPDGTWVVKVKPTYLPDPEQDIRSVYKMGLLVADCQAHTTKMLNVIDQVLVEQKQMREIHNEIVQAKQDKAKADVDRYQTKFDFEQEDVI